MLLYKYTTTINTTTTIKIPNASTQSKWPLFIYGQENNGHENNGQENNGQESNGQDNNGRVSNGNGKRCNTKYCTNDSDTPEEANYTFRFDFY